MSFPIDINPSISTLVENAQRTNPVFGKQTKSEAKIKRFKPQRAAAAQGDSTNLSGDMLGDMDPDEYKGKDHSADFKERLKEWREEESRREQEKDEEKEQEAPPQEPPEESYSDDDDQEKQREQQNRALSKDAVKAPEESGINAGFEREGSARQRDGLEKSGELQEEESKEGAGEKDRGPYIRRRESEYEDYSDRLNDEPSGGLGESIVVKNREEKQAGAFLSSAGDFSSLLTYDDGFIIADPKKEVVPSGEGDISDIEKAGVSRPSEEEAIPASLMARFEKAFSDILILKTPPEPVERVKAQLRKFGAGVLDACRADGIKVLIIPRSENLQDYGHLFKHGFKDGWEKVRCGYFPWEKIMVIGEEAVTGGDPLINPIILYFAFAFDHALGSEGFASEHSPAVVANYQSCSRGEGGRQFIDYFSSFSPVHYFAQAVEAFLTAPQGVLIPETTEDRGVLCTKEQLYDNDRAMFTYIEYLFKRINKT